MTNDHLPAEGSVQPTSMPMMRSMCTVIVSGPAAEREKLAVKITELFQTMGKVTLHYPKVDLRPATFPEGLEVAVLETSSTPERTRA